MTSLNNSSIGIEIVNRSACVIDDPDIEEPEPEDQRCTFLPFPDEQTELVIRLAQEILARNPDIDPVNVIGHGDIATSPDGELYGVVRGRIARIDLQSGQPVEFVVEDVNIPGVMEMKEFLRAQVPEGTHWVPTCTRQDNGDWLVEGFER